MRSGKGRVFPGGITSRSYGLREFRRQQRMGPRVRNVSIIAMIAILQSADKIEEMGQHAQHLGETKYAWESIALKTIDAYQSLIVPCRGRC